MAICGSPAITFAFGDAVLVSDSDAVWSVVTVVPPVAVVGLLLGSSPLMVAEFTIDPASTSACVAV